MLQEYLNRLEQLVNIDSSSLDPTGITAVADVIEDWFRDLGWQVQRHDVGKETGPLLEISNRGTDRYDAVLLGHMDTVFPGGTAGERPFRVEGNMAYGPGVVDMKNGLAAMYMIAAALTEDPAGSPAVCMLFNPDEEIGSCYSRAKLCEIVGRSSRLYVMEGSGGHGAIHCHARKGIVEFRVTCHGQSAHAGNILDRPGASAILEAARWTEFLCGLVDREKAITANVGTIRGGVAANVVPEYATLHAEVRTESVADMDAIVAKIRERAACPVTPGVTVELSILDICQPLAPGAGTLQEIERAKAIAASLGQAFCVEKSGGLSDANILCADRPELICLDDMGTAGDNAHSPEEYMEIDTVEPCIALMTALLKDLKK